MRRQDAHKITGATSNPKKKAAETKDDLKRKEKEDVARKEEEQREKDKIAAAEKIKVREEASVFSRRLGAIMDKFKVIGETKIINTFRFYDKDNSGSLSLVELTTALTKTGVRVNPDEIIYIYDFIDEDHSDSITYREFTDVIFGRRKIDAQKFIAEKRHKLGLDTGISPSEIAADRMRSQVPRLNT